MLGTPSRRGSRILQRRPGLRPRRSANYGDAEFLDHQARLTDLIPSRMTTLILLAAGAGLIAALVQLYAWMPRLASLLSAGRMAAFDLAQRGTVATWLASTSLVLAAGMAVLVYTVRRHKRDDYHGYYRVWLWAAMAWLLLSLETTSGLHDALAEVMGSLSGTRLWGDGSVWWVVLYGFLLGGVGTRLAIDMRQCRLSTAALVLAAGCFLLALTARFGGLSVDDPVRQVLLRKGPQLAGSLLVLLAMTLHARFVLLDAQGLLPARRSPAVSDLAARWEEEAAEPLEEDEEVDDHEIDPVREQLLSGGNTASIHPPHALARPNGPFVGLVRPEESDPGPAAVSGGSKSRESRPASGSSSSSATPSPLPTLRRKLTKQEKKVLRARLEKMREQRRGQEEE